MGKRKTHCHVRDHQVKLIWTFLEQLKNLNWSIGGGHSIPETFENCLGQDDRELLAADPANDIDLAQVVFKI